jgi:hypothetical protein
MNIDKIVLIATSAVLISLSACRKDKEETTFDSENLSNENVSSMVDKSLSDDEDAVSLRSGSGGCGINWPVATCAVVTEDSETFPKTITVDYGDGCVDIHGRTKSGKIFIHLTDELINIGAVRTVTFENYFINSVQIEGSRTATNLGPNSSDQPTFNRIVDVAITYNGSTFQRDFVETITWISGFETDECGDNVLSIEGTGSVTRPNGIIVPRTTTTPLTLDYTCGYIISGVIQVVAPLGTFTIDYGNGECDDEAVLTRPNGETQTITLQH